MLCTATTAKLQIVVTFFTGMQRWTSPTAVAEFGRDPEEQEAKEKKTREETRWATL